MAYQRVAKLSTPSLGITGLRTREATPFLPIFQLPLSGSHDQLAPLGELNPVYRFQLPLSGSPPETKYLWSAAAGTAFNSLSRDH
jgi:hypothetical protein